MNHHRGEDREHFIDEIRQKQRNIVFPDTVRNARSVDAFLWRGSPNPTMVQRIGAWLFGLTLIGGGVLFLDLARTDGALVFLIAALLLLLGARVCRNGFPRNPKS